MRLFLAPSSNLSLFLNKRSCFSRTRTFFFALALRCARLTDLRRFFGLTIWRKPDACFMRPPPWKKSSAYVVVVVVDVDADADARVPRNLTQQNRLCWLAPSEKGPSGVCPNAEKSYSQELLEDVSNEWRRQRRRRRRRRRIRVQSKFCLNLVTVNSEDPLVARPSCSLNELVGRSFYKEITSLHEMNNYVCYRAELPCLCLLKSNYSYRPNPTS